MQVGTNGLIIWDQSDDSKFAIEPSLITTGLHRCRGLWPEYSLML